MKRLSPFAKLYLTCAVVAFAGPFVFLIVASLAFRWAWPDLLPNVWWWTARGSARLPVGWDFVFSSASGALPALRNTVLIALVVTFLCALICLPAARALATREFRGKAGLEFFLLTPLVVPEIAVGLGILVIFLRLGLAGGFMGVIIAHLIPTIPYMTRILTAVFQNLDTSYEAQARTLGAGPLQTWWFVTLPLVAPGLLAGGLFTFLVSSNLFLLTFFVSRGSVQTLPTLLFSKLAGGGGLDPVAAGLALLVSVPGVVLLVLTEKLIRDEVLGSGLGF